MFAQKFTALEIVYGINEGLAMRVTFSVRVEFLPNLDLSDSFNLPPFFNLVHLSLPPEYNLLQI